MHVHIYIYLTAIELVICAYMCLKEGEVGFVDQPLDWAACYGRGSSDYLSRAISISAYSICIQCTK